MDEEDYMLTTVDNPWNPFTNYDEWYAFDSEHAYHTPSLLARVAKVSFELSDLDQDLAIKSAIDEIVENNVLGLYRKAFRP